MAQDTPAYFRRPRAGRRPHQLQCSRQRRRHRRLHGLGAHAGLDVQCVEVRQRAACEDRSFAAQSQRRDTGRRDDQVRLRRNRVLHRWRPRPRADEPGSDRPAARPGLGRDHRLRQLHRREGEHHLRSGRAGRACGNRRRCGQHRLRRRSAPSCRRIPSTRSSRFPESRQSRRTRSTSRRTTTPRSSARRPYGRRSAGRPTPATTSSSAPSTPASGPRIRWSRRPACRHRPVASAAASSATAATSRHLGPTFACNNKLIGAYAFTNTYMAQHRVERARVLQQRDVHVLAARL